MGKEGERVKTIDEFEQAWRGIKRKDKLVLIKGIWRHVNQYKIVHSEGSIYVTFWEGPFQTVAYPLNLIEGFK